MLSYRSANEHLERMLRSHRYLRLAHPFYHLLRIEMPRNPIRVSVYGTTRKEPGSGTTCWSQTCRRSRLYPIIALRGVNSSSGQEHSHRGRAPPPTEGGP